MTGKEFFNSIARGQTDIVQQLLDILAETAAEYCVVGGLAVNAYAEPVVSLDLDIIVAADKVEEVAAAAEARGMKLERFEHSLNLTSQESDLWIWLRSDPRYQDFIARSNAQEILGYPLRVAAKTDVLQGKVWAYLDKSRRKSKRQKDLADIVRLVEADATLEALLPPTIRQRLGEC